MKDSAHHFLSNLIALLFGFLITCAIFFIAEGLLKVCWREEVATDTKYEADYFYSDPFGITKPLPDGRYPSSSKIKKSGRMIYDVVYTVDHDSRRVTPLLSLDGRNRFLLFFGCSFTYGEGLEDDETIPYFTAREAGKYVPYNYSFHGHGPAEMLLKMRSQTLPEEVKEREGILIYIFIDAHVLRTIGSMRISTSWGHNRPYFYWDGQGHLLHKGSFSTGRPLVQSFYRLLAKSRILRFFKIDFPLRIGNQHLYLTARVIEESRNEFMKQFPRGEFYVVIYPGSQLRNRLFPFLEEMNIKYLDYASLFRRDDPQYFLAPEDEHPNVLANKIVANQLTQDLFPQILDKGRKV